MKHKNLIPILLPVLLITMVIFMTQNINAASVIKDGEKVFIKDQRGEVWDVTQAQSIGFEPRLFQFGIGKNAFTPLDDSDLKSNNPYKNKNPRVIGITNQDEAHAYSVPKLNSHEIANTHIGNKPVSVGY